MISAHKKRPHQFHRIQSTSNPPHSLREWFITLTTDVMSRSGLLGYHSGRGLLLLGVALTVTAQDGGTFSLLLVGGRARRASGLTATAPGGDVVLLIKNPPPEGSASAALPPEFLTSGILEICEKNSWATNGMKIFRTNSARLRFGSCLFQVKRKKNHQDKKLPPRNTRKHLSSGFFNSDSSWNPLIPIDLQLNDPEKKHRRVWGKRTRTNESPQKNQPNLPKFSHLTFRFLPLQPPARESYPLPQICKRSESHHNASGKENNRPKKPKKTNTTPPNQKKKNAKTTYDLLGSSPIPSDPGPAATTNSPTIESPNYGGIDL